MDPQQKTTEPVEKEASYEEAGYDKFLTRYVLNKTFYSALNFDSMVEDEGISTSNILMQIKNGQIDIQDKKGNSVLDKFGLVSTTQFQFGTVSGAGSQGVSGSTDYFFVTGLNLEFTLDRASQVMFFLQTSGYATGNYSDGAVRQLSVAVYLDNTTVLTPTIGVMGARFGDPVSVYSGEVWGLHYLQTLDAGTHTAAVIFGTTNASYQAVIFRNLTRLTYLRLGV